MSANNIKNVVLAAVATVGSALANALGGWDAVLKVLVFLMAADYITGLAIAAIWQKSNKSEGGALDSRASFKGLCKKCAILMLVGLGVMLDNALKVDYIRTAIILFFVGNEGLSLVENVVLMGVPCPPFLKNVLEVLKDKNGNGGQDE
ncbi:MAG: phage holin family protein [Clostridiaceae bacterium]|nr:phage holin family protein [Clostridiaceae bacterium]